MATFRSDGGIPMGGIPTRCAIHKTAEEDVQRRDFTINGLLLDPLALSRRRDRHPRTP